MFRDIIAVIISNKVNPPLRPETPRKNECENCWKHETELYYFNTAKLCKTCFEYMKKRFPEVNYNEYSRYLSNLQ